MSEKPILFSGAMVRAILAGRKTQTRRVFKMSENWAKYLDFERSSAPPRPLWERRQKFSRYQVGDILWVRETWKPYNVVGAINQAATSGVIYRADGARHEIAETYGAWKFDRVGRWRPSIFMPKWAARIWLRVLKVRCERLQEISLHDVYAEGFPHLTCESFRVYWDSLNAKRDYGWDSNPWVWVYEFKRNE